VGEKATEVVEVEDEEEEEEEEEEEDRSVRGGCSLWKWGCKGVSRVGSIAVAPVGLPLSKEGEV
jgi:hypothetical protein